jgi:hypothetical protein
MRAHWLAGTGRITAFAVTRGAGRGVAALGAGPLVGAVAAPPDEPEADEAETVGDGVDVDGTAATLVAGAGGAGGVAGEVAHAESASAVVAASATPVRAGEDPSRRRTAGPVMPTRLACPECSAGRAGCQQV